MTNRMFQSEYYDLYDRVVRINDNESLYLKRLQDNTVLVSIEDELSGTLTKLAYYHAGRWTGYNAGNYAKLFSLFREYKHLKPKLIKFLTPFSGAPEIKQLNKVFTCARRKFIISIKSVTKNI